MDNQELNNIDEGSMAMDSLKPASHPVTDDSKSKFEYIKHAIGAMHAMSKDELVKWHNQTIAQYHAGKDWGVGDKSSHNQSSIDMHGSAASSSTGPKTRDPMPKLSVKEDVEEMFAGQDLSEEFKEKASTLFEAAVTARTMLEVARLEEEYQETLEEAVNEINEELTSKIDSYLDYVVESWMKENEVAIESTLRNELTSDFIDGLRNLFAEHYVDVPQDKVNVVESLAEKVEELEARLNDQINENIEIKRSLLDAEKDAIVESFSEGLALSQQEKFKALVEGVDFDGDFDTYARKLSIIKENYFAIEKKAPVSTNIEEETFEIESSTTVGIDPTVSKYVQAISRTLKK